MKNGIGAEAGRPIQQQLRRGSSWPENAAPYYRPSLIAAIAACAGVIVGSIGPWVKLFMFSADGLDFQNWGALTLALGAVSGIGLFTVLLWATTPFNPTWTVPMTIFAALSGAACFAIAAVNMSRVFRIPGHEVLGINLAPHAGWGLWLLAISGLVLAITGSVVARQAIQELPTGSFPLKVIVPVAGGAIAGMAAGYAIFVAFGGPKT
jgi:hypothetical protein